MNPDPSAKEPNKARDVALKIAKQCGLPEPSPDPVGGTPELLSILRENSAAIKQLATDVARLIAERDAALADNAALRADKERLDYLSASPVSERIWMVSRTSPSEEGTENNVRAAIDAARAVPKAEGV